jgi:hypothetical protein
MLLVLATGLQATGKSTVPETAGGHLDAPVRAHDLGNERFAASRRIGGIIDP